jgi:MarR family transcriptional regulator for hemolysin
MNLPVPHSSIGFLLTDISRFIRKLSDRRLAAIGLTRAQCHVLISLKRLGPLTQSALAEIIEVETATIARLVARLETKGWVERRQDQRDRRIKIVSITDKSTAIMDQVDRIAQLLANDMLSELSWVDRDNLVEQLGILKCRLTWLLAQQQP